MAQTNKTRARCHFTGIVQGVGFRPTLHRLAAELRLTGWVLNSTTGVVCEVEGAEAVCREFFRRMHEEAPPLARITSSFLELLPPAGFTGFHIRASEEEAGEITLISPDTAICADCVRELLDPADRRYRYPFINCTNCGPRYSIIEALPYDRPNTTMREFALCDDCRREYEDPEDRRYHAQPNACPVCGPQVWLAAQDGSVLAQRDDAVREAVQMLAAGRILAVKGVGGFHLACDALNEQAVDELRRRKQRARFKPLAIMVKDFAVLRDLAQVAEPELALLASPVSPIVLADKRRDSPYALAPMVAPRTNLLGVMVPYTPLHLLLFNTQLEEPALAGAETLEILVMTSGNLSEEPLAYENDEALRRLAPLADAFLLHNRRIIAPSDDSIVRVMAGEPRVFRLGRGYAPYPVALTRDPRKDPPAGCVVGWGPDMKATFALQAGRFALLSPHLGDQESVWAQAFHHRTYEHFKRVFRQSPSTIVADLHPGYFSRRLAQDEARAAGAAFCELQHHHAHLSSAVLESGLKGRVIALALDGTGYGSDGTVWGGEILVGTPAECQRVGMLRTLPLPGGESAIAQTWRLALALLHETVPSLLDGALAALRDWAPPADGEMVAAMLRQQVNLVPCSSLGRLFDAFSALLGICTEATYEAQAAIELEMAADHRQRGPAETEPPAAGFALHERAGLLVLDYAPIVEWTLAQLHAAGLEPLGAAAATRLPSPKLVPPEPIPALARAFIDAVITAYSEATRAISEREGVRQVVLGGGCFQNKLLLEGMIGALRAAGLKVFTHSAVPMNDAGVALGQLAHGLSCTGRFR